VSDRSCAIGFALGARIDASRDLSSRFVSPFTRGLQWDVRILTEADQLLAPIDPVLHSPEASAVGFDQQVESSAVEQLAGFFPSA
jgi:hypothetical protein